MKKTSVLSALIFVSFTSTFAVSALAEEQTRANGPSPSALTAKERCLEVFKHYVAKYDQTEAQLIAKLKNEGREGSSMLIELSRLMAPVTFTLNEFYDQCNKSDLDDEQAAVVESVFN